MGKGAKTPSAVPGWARFAITLVVIAGALALVYTQLPKNPMSTDLSRIGQGTPALVVARDISFVAGAEVMDLMNEIRPEYAGRAEFLVAHLGRPEGQSFARRFDARDGTVILFAGDGSVRTTLRAPRTAAELRRALDAVLAH
jgi:hypothetical protein